MTEMARKSMNTAIASYFAGDYAGVTHAGLCIVAADTGNVFLAQRAMDETDAPDVQETWEFPGGSLEPGESPWQGASREFTEETGLGLPQGKVENGWRSPNGVYQGFVYAIPEQFDITDWQPTAECQSIAWVSVDGAQQMPNLRPEMADFDWSLAKVSGNQEDDMSEMDTESPSEDAAEAMEEPDLSLADLIGAPLMIHGVMAPEGAETGDGRAFKAGSITSRPNRLPFSHQKSAIQGHDGSVVTGSVDRMMRKDGLIHWEGQLMPTEEADDLCGLICFFGQYGVSIDGDKGSVDGQQTADTGVLWFDAVRAAGLTAVAIPAFHEAYVALGPHPDMPPASDDAMTASLVASGDLVQFNRGPGWVTDPKATKRIHDYWMPGHPGGDKIAWGTPGDFARAKALIGEKIAKNSPTKARFLNQIIAQWHHDALGYWPATHAKMDRAAMKASVSGNVEMGAAHGGALEVQEELFNEAYEQGRIEEVGEREDGAIIYDLYADYEEAIENTEAIEASDNGWEAVLVSSVATEEKVYVPASYFSKHENTGALVIEEPDEYGFRRVHGFAGRWGVCHVGIDGRCVELPEDPGGGDFPDFHLGSMRTDSGDINVGVITYKVDHRSGQRILSQTAQQQHFDNVAHAWCAVRLGQDDDGIWFSGVVLPGIPEEDLILIQATGQVSGEWKYGSMRALQSVNTPGFPVLRSSASYDDEGEIEILVASATGGACEPTPAERMHALAEIDAEVRFARLKEAWS